MNAIAIAEVCFLAAATWPLLRLIAAPAFRRPFPPTAMRLGAFLAAFALLVAALAALAPVGLHVLAIPALVAVAAERWRARSSYGRRRGLPPGRLSVVPYRQVLDDRYFLEQAARYGPVFKAGQFAPGVDPILRRPFHPVTCVVGLERGLETLRRLDHTLSPPTAPFSRYIPGGFLRYMDQDAHSRYRKMLRDAFSRAVVEQREPFLAETARAGLQRLAVAPGGALADPGVTELLFPMFAALFLGVEPSDRRLPALRGLYQVIDYRRVGKPDRVRAALGEIGQIVQDRIAEETPHDDEAAPSFLGRLVSDQPAAVEDETVLGNLVYLLQTTWLDTAGLCLWLLKMLTDRPFFGERLRAGEDGLAERFVLETLRLEQSEYIIRRVPQPIEVDGFSVPAGWILRICVRESHRSPDAFELPDDFEPDRFRDREYTRTEYSPFGAYRIACLGDHLALAVGRAFLSELACGYDVTVIADGPREFRGWHWKPSSRFRIHLLRAQPAESISAGAGLSR